MWIGGFDCFDIYPNTLYDDSTYNQLTQCLFLRKTHQKPPDFALELIGRERLVVVYSFLLLSF